MRLLAGGAIVLAATASGVVASGAVTLSAAPAVDIPTRHLVAAPTHTTQAAQLTVSVPPLPVPAPAPGDSFNGEPVVQIGSIAIPSISLDHSLFEGVGQTVLAAGPGHWPGTAEPGGWGNAVVAAHRQTHGAPFHDIDHIQAGDPIVLTTPAGTFTYAVTGAKVVPNTDFSIVDQHPGRTLTLFSCHPIGSSAQRYVVTATLVSSQRA
jgi:sortase A